MSDIQARFTGETQPVVNTSNITDPESEEMNTVTPKKNKLNDFLANNEKHAQMQRALALSFISSQDKSKSNPVQ